MTTEELTAQVKRNRRLINFLLCAIVGLALAFGFAWMRAERATEKATTAVFTSQKIQDVQTLAIKRQSEINAMRIEQEAKLKEDAISRNLKARYDDCQIFNKVLKNLRTNVHKSEEQTPFLLKILPEFNRPDVLRLAKESNARQLREAAPLNCHKYAERAAP